MQSAMQALSSTQERDDNALNHRERAKERRQLLRDLVDFTIDVATGDRALGLPFSRQKEGIDKAVWLANQLIEHLDNRLQHAPLVGPYWLAAMQKQLRLSPHSYPLAEIGKVLSAVTVDHPAASTASRFACFETLLQRCQGSASLLSKLVLTYNQSVQSTLAHDLPWGEAAGAAVRCVIQAVNDPQMELSVATLLRVPLWLLVGPVLSLLRSAMEAEMLEAAAGSMESSQQTSHKSAWVDQMGLLQTRLAALAQFASTRELELKSAAAKLLTVDSAQERDAVLPELDAMRSVDVSNLEWACRSLVSRQELAAAHSPHSSVCGRFHRSTLWVLLDYSRKRQQTLQRVVSHVMGFVVESTTAINAEKITQLLQPLSCALRQDILEECVAEIEKETSECTGLARVLEREPKAAAARSELDRMNKEQQERLDLVWEML